MKERLAARLAVVMDAIAHDDVQGFGHVALRLWARRLAARTRLAVAALRAVRGAHMDAERWGAVWGLRTEEGMVRWLVAQRRKPLTTL